MALPRDSSASDILALTKLAWNLYHNCYLIIVDTSEGSKQLVNELASLQGALRVLRDDVNSNSSFFENRHMGVGDGTQFWQRDKWITQREQIDDLNQRNFPSTPQTLSQGERVLRTPPLTEEDEDISTEVPLHVDPRDIPIRMNSLPNADTSARISASESILSGKSEWSTSTANTTSTFVCDHLKPLAQLEIYPALQEESFSDDRSDPLAQVQELNNTAVTNKLLRPLRYEPRDKLHQPDPEPKRKFNALVQDELAIKRLNRSDWLQVAVWWLLKRLGPPGHQAYADLSYILYDIVLTNASSNVIPTNRKARSFHRKLSFDQGIKEELARFTSVDVPEYSAIHSQSLKIWEPLQPEEAVEKGDNSIISLSNVRWVTVDLEDAGDEEEKVFYRTLVNAGIGSKRLRMRTKGAPYMLLLSTREGESEPEIPICNQSGTISLQRDCLYSGFSGLKISEPVLLRFDTRSVSVCFQHKSDLQYFINLPKAYFDVVWQREPMDSGQFAETIIFKSSVEKFEKLKAHTMRSMNPPIFHKSCEMRILERSYERHGNLFGSNGQVRAKKGQRKQMAIFILYTLMCMMKIAQTSDSDFEKAILSISSGYVYNVVNSSENQKQYKAILLILSRLNWKYGSIYYVYRDTDYIYHHRALRVRFPRIFYTDYISSHVDRLYPVDRPVSFSHCEKKPFLRSFVGSLANGYELLLSRRAVSLVTKGKSLLGPRKRAAIQLSSRWDDHITKNLN
ncbi:uncharacterized protein BDW43DRAFT_302078 [Aspergillus alliaceus]|uniref:uncharacterized protein n=1 Tax=Petromyces alliaceus TaxID=209559 RepID=UPI0012A67BBE|nr:uncharacterized protein BDW43DRAFT_302078 [Aspergillus alliaceus]KAB8230988.1 hypothetical protein BDW43DRAFT_302078 [Aspergillus alliaceus]